MANQYFHLSDQEEVSNRRLGKKHVLLGCLIGTTCYGCAFVFSQYGQQATDPTNAMSMDLPRGQSVQSRNLLSSQQLISSTDWWQQSAMDLQCFGKCLLWTLAGSLLGPLLIPPFFFLCLWLVGFGAAGIFVTRLLQSQARCQAIFVSGCIPQKGV